MHRMEFCGKSWQVSNLKKYLAVFGQVILEGDDQAHEEENNAHQVHSSGEQRATSDNTDLFIGEDP